ncbi:hypothetical protein FPANT_11824 [Fusarium pseudoanthophilum]|uniref:F-box domain-containing protein n=1 Tax=Fusarium pseudoanthophilum TaxID=48495 RepID=A0A8H5NRK2_9HYPO|nr:hypothetical protein FPANT_11824 [Fusarium pseudoanthophilum]
MDLFSPLPARQLRFYTRFLAPCTTIKPRPASAVGLNSLPEEILIDVIQNIYEGSDKPSLFAFFALRQVSQRFRRLTRDEAFDSHLFSDKDCCEQCISSSGTWARKKSAPATITNIDLPLAKEKHCFGYKAQKRGICLRGLNDWVSKGKTCSTCQKWLRVRTTDRSSLKCKFSPQHSAWKKCTSCGVSHPSSCFSAGEDRCIARSGYIRLCEHKTLDLRYVQSFINDPQCHSTKSQKVKIMSCEDPSHYSSCSTELDGPKAELTIYATGGGLLSLTFTGNSDPDLTPDRGIGDILYGMNHETGTMTLPMPVIYEEIRSVREKGGKHFAPERISGVLPELSALDLEDISTDASSHDNPVKVIHPTGAKPPTHSSLLHHNPPQGNLRITAEPCPHLGSHAKHSCIRVRYQRSIRVGWAPFEGKLQQVNLPDHAWFHAISRESYTYSGPPGAEETCDDEACRNYYAITSSRSHFPTTEVELSRYPRPWDLDDTF